MARYILEGDDKSVRDIIRMNKILVARGKVSFTPCEENPVDVAEDDKSLEDIDTKDVSLTDTKKPIRQKKTK